MTIGVPQGSILGHLLYLLYVNDINNSCDGAILSFADDTTQNSEIFIFNTSMNIWYITLIIVIVIIIK